VWTVRLTQTFDREDSCRIQINLEGDSSGRQSSIADRLFALPEQDQEDLRWYFEDYLQQPFDPAPVIARGIERRMAEIGAGLFESVFHANEETRRMWGALSSDLSSTRIEVLTPGIDTGTIPWELLFEPVTGTHLALHCHSFVRVASTPPPATPIAAGPIRILLVMSRPVDSGAVPFRSVAGRLLQSVHGRPEIDLEVLRPPTFAQLNARLLQARTEGRPYHVLHFDGHGIYEDLQAVLANLPPKKKRGYLLFESADDHRNEPIHGTLLGRSMVEGGVPLLVLNACRSAHAEAPASPGKEGSGNRVRAFGSLAEEVVEAGVPGVVAMRHNVYVATAAKFVSDLYTSLVRGLTLGEAVAEGRKQLSRHPERDFAYGPRQLQDWPVPVVFETTPITLCTGAAAEEAERQDTGFIGRDETLLDLERAFNAERIVLLHAYAGSGKSATAAEFARWYTWTGGVEAVLRISFERFNPLARVLDVVELAFRDRLQQQRADWLALDLAARRALALQIFRDVPALWIWDNVEPVAGFPAGASSEWSAAEQRELVDFLRDASQTKARFLLTSRREESEWLGGLPVRRLLLPPMPMPERVQMLRSLAGKHGQLQADVLDWLPVLDFTEGNPLTIMVVVGQALRDRLATREQLDSFVARLRAGEVEFADDQREGRTASLGASLGYGFAHAFTPGELKLLALLALFQGFVDVTALYYMGHPELGDLPLLRDWPREARIALLNRAAEVGLLTACVGSVEGVIYAIHPALPWFFKKLFDEHYPMPTNAVRAYATAIGATGVYYHEQYYDKGDTTVIDSLAAAEANLQHTGKLSHANGWWKILISAVQGLQTLYAHTGREAEWQRLVDEILPDFVEPSTNEPRRGREEEWGLITEYRVALAVKARRWAEAERLQIVRVEWERKRAAPLATLSPDEMDPLQRRAVHALAAALGWMGDILLQRADPECVSMYQEAIQLYQRLGETRHESSAAAQLGDVYRELPALRDLDKAEQWYQRALQRLDEGDRLGRGRRMADLGLVAYERHDLDAAAQWYEKALRALKSLSAEAVSDLGAAHNQLGVIYDTRDGPGDFARSLSHYRKSIRYLEKRGDFYGAASARMNVAITLHGNGRFARALLYAQAALKNYERYGQQAASEIERTRQAIDRIEQDLKAEGDKPYVHV
jgi:tetratricopeptide (TPR) repeat protein